MGGFLQLVLLVKQVMLKKGSKIIILSIIWNALTSCQDHKIIIEENKSLQTLQRKNFTEYESIYKACNDSLSEWIFDSLKATQTIHFYEWQLDSVFVFNSTEHEVYESLP